MTWLITGGSGQLGIAISEELDKCGILFHSWGSQELDITNGPTVHDLISQLAPKVIVNCAAWTDVDGAEVNEIQAIRVNGEGAENLAFAAKNCSAKLIHVSTDYVFSGEGKIPWQIDAMIKPQSAYGRSKAEGESRVLATYPENSSIVRTAWLYSSWGKNFAMTMTRLAINGIGEVRVVDDQIGQPTFAVDLAKQIVELGLSNLSAGVFHGTNSGEASWYEFAREIFILANADVDRVIPVHSSEYQRPAKRPAYSVLSHETWANTTIKPIRNWRIALQDAMPSIIRSVKEEE